MRTPCTDAPTCTTFDDLEDADGPDSDTYDDDMIVKWQIQAECDTAGVVEGCSLDADMDRDWLTKDRTSENSEIHTSLINISSDNVLDESSNGCDGIGCDDIYNFINTTVFWAGRIDTVIRPVLKITVIHRLDEDGGVGDVFPYLEYQLASTTLDPPGANVYQTISSEGTSGSFKQALEIKKGLETGVLEFVIHQ